MHGIEWLFASLPLVGLVAVLAEVVLRDPHALLEMASDTEAFARAKAVPTVADDAAPIGVALHA